MTIAQPNIDTLARVAPKLHAAAVARMDTGMSLEQALADIGKSFVANHLQGPSPEPGADDGALSGYGSGMRRLFASGLAACMKPFTPQGRGRPVPADPDARYKAACEGTGSRSLAAIACGITFHRQG